MSQTLQLRHRLFGKKQRLYLITAILLTCYLVLLVVDAGNHRDLQGLYRSMLLTALLALYGFQATGKGQKTLLLALAGYSFFRFNSTMLWQLGVENLYTIIPTGAHTATAFYFPQFISPVVWIAGMILLITRPKTGKAVKLSAAGVAFIQFLYLLIWLTGSFLIHNISETLLNGLVLFYEALKYIDIIVLGLFFAALAFSQTTQQAMTPATPQPVETMDTPLVTAP